MLSAGTRSNVVHYICAKCCVLSLTEVKLNVILQLMDWQMAGSRADEARDEH